MLLYIFKLVRFSPYMGIQVAETYAAAGSLEKQQLKDKPVTLICSFTSLHPSFKHFCLEKFTGTLTIH